MTEPQQPLLSVKNLTVEFPSDDGRVTAVNDISFDIMPGEIVALVGESGSGKSATGLSIMRLVEHGTGVISRGNIYLSPAGGNSTDLVKFTEQQMIGVRGKQVAMIFQEPMTSLNPALTCGRQVSEVIVRHLGKSTSEAKSITTNILSEVEIEQPQEAFHKYPHQYSGGQKQRMLLATALAADPQLLIADEPTTALDAYIKHRINKLIQKIQKERNLSVLYVTHDLDAIESVADRVLVMYAGKIVEHGTVEQIFHHPKHPYTKGLLACRPPSSGRYYFLPTTDDFMRISMDGQGVQDSGNIEEILASLRISDEERDTFKQRIFESEPILKVSHLHKSYQRGKGLEVAAVVDVSLKLHPGETLGLVGASGCGKTTLGRCIIGLTEPDSGQVLLRDRSANAFQPAPALNRIGSRIQYIFQDPYSSLNPRKTIGQALMEPLNLLRIGSVKGRMNMVQRMLERVGLKAFHVQRYPHEFSGGQRQRICIARALLLEPEIIVCDEAVSALDVSVQAQVLNLLNELKYEYGLSFLFISHDLDVVRFMSERIMVMKDGKIVEEGEADEVFADPQHAYTKELMA